MLVMHIVSSLVFLISVTSLCALHIHSENAFSVKTFPDGSNVCLAAQALHAVPSRAGGLSVSAKHRLGFWPKTN